MGEIYCLYSTFEGVPRYIGMTEGSAEKRYKKHVASALELANGELYDWIRETWRAKHDVSFHVLQTDIIPAELSFYERYWMSQFPNLFNKRDNDAPPKGLSELGQHIVVAIKTKLTVEDQR